MLGSSASGEIWKPPDFPFAASCLAVQSTHSSVSRSEVEALWEDSAVLSPWLPGMDSEAATPEGRWLLPAPVTQASALATILWLLLLQY